MCSGANASTQLEGWGNANWASDVQTHQSTTGFAFTFKGDLFPSNLENKKNVGLSSIEAKYIVATSTSQECTWLHQLLTNLGYHQPSPLTIFCDNQSSILLSKDPKFHS